MQIGKTKLGAKPVILAPLEDIADSAFRNICKLKGADMVYTEFVSSEALIRSAVKSTQKMLFEEAERPLGIQIFGNNLDAMKLAAQMAAESNPELIDINFGCPVRKVAMKGAGAALLKDIPLMLKITKEVVKSVSIPVTVKTRLGWDDKSRIICDIAEPLQDTGIQALTIHGRTRAQMYSGNADWSMIGEVKNNPRIHIPIIGNGDIDSPVRAAEMFEKYGVDGIMIGRAAIGNPWIFEEIKEYLLNKSIPAPPTLEERVLLCLQHLKLAIEKKGEIKGSIEMRRHYAGYFRGIPGFKKVRMQILTLKSFVEIENILLNNLH